MKQLISGSPNEFAENLYWSYSEFEELSTDQIKKLCNKTLDILMTDSDTMKRVFYGEAKKIIKER